MEFKLWELLVLKKVQVVGGVILVSFQIQTKWNFVLV
jgi:hypothetical protein